MIPSSVARRVFGLICVCTLLWSYDVRAEPLSPKCIPDLAGKRYVIQDNGPRVLFELAQTANKLSGTATWMDEAWVRVINNADVTGDVSVGHLTLRVMWSRGAGEKLAWYTGVFRPNRTLEGYTYQQGNPQKTVPWSAQGSVSCLPQKPVLTIERKDNSSRVTLHVSLAPADATPGNFTLYRDGTSFANLEANREGDRIGNTYIVSADAHSAFRACYKTIRQLVVCSEDVQRPLRSDDATVIAANVAERSQVLRAPDRQGAVVTPSAIVSPALVAEAGGACASGFVWREARRDDRVCVSPGARARVRAENADAITHLDRGVAYGPNSCKSGFVWREAYTGDVVCVPPQSRDLARTENRLAASRLRQP